MKSSELNIRPATAADLEEWYGTGQRNSFKGIVGEVDGEVVAIGGVYRSQGLMIGIAGLRPHVRHRKKDAVRFARAGQKVLQGYPFVVAFADKDEPTAEGLIKHLGFEHRGSTEIGEMYLWTNKHKAL